MLRQVAFSILQARTGSRLQVLKEWDIEDRILEVWAHVGLTREAGLGVWPHQRLSVMTWLIYLLCLELDNHLGLRGPF